MPKDIYIKTEPGGKVGFGQLTEREIALFQKSKRNKKLSADLLFKIRRGVAPYLLSTGVVNTGNEGEKGNEGVIKLAEDRVAIPTNELGEYVSGVYFAYLSLSKVSVEFKVPTKPTEEYDPNRLEEISIRVDLPSCVKHQTYNDLGFNIVGSYRYEGKAIKNANRGLIDRGYEESLSIFEVEDGQVCPLYESLGDEEVFF